MRVTQGLGNLTWKGIKDITYISQIHRLKRLEEETQKLLVSLISIKVEWKSNKGYINFGHVI